MKVYVLARIGCIECGVPSDILGVFKSKKKAEALKAKQQDTWNEFGGDGYYTIFKRKVLTKKKNLSNLDL